MTKKVRPAPNRAQALELARVDLLEPEYIIGIDEVGYGAGAGPVVVGAVAVPRGWDAHGVLDSKALSPKQRLHALKPIHDNAVAWVIEGTEAAEFAGRSVHEVRDDLVVKVALALTERLSGTRTVVVQDGDVPVVIPGRNLQNMGWMPKADVVVPAVSAASIIAKLHRDGMMVEYDEVFPEYLFAKHKGYLTEEHMEALRRHGPCVLHRLNYKPVREVVQFRNGHASRARFTT